MHCTATTHNMCLNGCVCIFGIVAILKTEENFVVFAFEHEMRRVKEKTQNKKKTKRNSLSKCYMCVKIIKEHKQMRFMIEHSLTYSVVAYVRAIYHNSRLRNCLKCLF